MSCTLVKQCVQAPHGTLRWSIELQDLTIDRLVYDLYGLTDDEIALVQDDQLMS